MDLWLADGVHAIMVDEDAVFLDVATNAYFCLPGIGAVLHIDGRALALSIDVLGEDLLEAGLARLTPSSQDGVVLASPRRTARAVLEDLPPGERRAPTWRHWRAVIAAGLANGRDQRRRFADRLPPAQARMIEDAGQGLLGDLDAFRRLSPWLPFDGVCLYRSGLLRRYLLALGHRAHWVFGVRTWPFAAHCWLQVGDLALDDEAERLVAYHPIMVL
jgi:hypothetical protein